MREKPEPTATFVRYFDKESNEFVIDLRCTCGAITRMDSGFFWTTGQCSECFARWAFTADNAFTE